MQLNELQRKTKRTEKKTVGRGGRRGKTSGRGHKGQKARAGHSIRPQIRDEIKKIPKLRGFKFNSIVKKPAVVNIQTLDEQFNDGDTVTPTALLEKRLISQVGGKMPRVKILGDGDVSKKLTIENCLVSKSAAEKITNAGGTISK